MVISAFKYTSTPLQHLECHSSINDGNLLKYWIKLFQVLHYNALNVILLYDFLP